jgi:hypothetical protein
VIQIYLIRYALRICHVIVQMALGKPMRSTNPRYPQPHIVEFTMHKSRQRGTQANDPRFRTAAIQQTMTYGCGLQPLDDALSSR